MIPLLMLVLSAFAQEPDREDPVDERITVEERRSDYQVVQIYVDLSEVIAPDGSKGTSMPLNVLISHHAQGSDLLRRRMQYWSNPYRWKGEVNIYDWSNVQHMPTFSDCDYGDSIKCGIKNRHWTLRTVVSVGKKYSVFTQKLYDETGKVISNSAQTAWGTIRWKPQWKLTTIKEQGAFGGSKKEIFEMWPPKMEELPPLIVPGHVGQAKFSIFSVPQNACRTKRCETIRARQRE